LLVEREKMFEELQKPASDRADTEASHSATDDGNILESVTKVHNRLPTSKTATPSMNTDFMRNKVYTLPKLVTTVSSEHV
jgi:hypothetical protein